MKSPNNTPNSPFVQCTSLFTDCVFNWFNFHDDSSTKKNEWNSKKYIST